MRGIRIQNIVKELHDEKIDVIEWVPEMESFIQKALSPARVSGVYLDDDPYEGRTAIVLVPDDQLSLAIGREGQNARLAAKLTGWRIDIKSIIETAQGAIDNLDTPPLDTIPQRYPDLTEDVRTTLNKKADNKAIMPEEYKKLARFANLVETALQELRDEMRAEEREEIEAVRATLPEELFRVPLDVLGLPRDIAGAIESFENVGELMLATLVDDPALDRALRAAPRGALERIQSKLDDLMDADIDYEEFIPAEADELEVDEDVLQEAEANVVEAVADEAVEEAHAEAEAVEETIAEDPEAVPVDDFGNAIEDDDDVENEAPEEEVLDVQPEAEADDEYEDETEEESQGDRRKRRRLVYDEETGEIVAKRRKRRK
jgi:N utilization substance protein A